MLAIIPARGGSKGLPGKNIRNFDGVPLIAHTIKAALAAECIDRVIVTTDSQAIADIAVKYGAEVPFLRPAVLASDESSAVDVYIHAINFIENLSDEIIHKFMVLLPTSPFRTNRHIDEAYKLFCIEKASTLISVKEAEIPPSWYFCDDNEKRIHNCGFGIHKGVMLNRQVENSYFIPNGAIYILDSELLRKTRSYYCDNTVSYLMNHQDSLDIDTLEDFEYAEYLAKKLWHS